MNHINYPTFSCNVSNTDSECGGILEGVDGELMSPGYPRPYGNTLRCTWTISVPQGQFVHLILEDMDTEPYFDFLEVYDGTVRDTDTMMAR